MKILMMTNSYCPNVGGIERSIKSFAREFKALGHQVLIVAPGPKGSCDLKERVARVPAVPNAFNTPYSINLPTLGPIAKTIERFKPDIIHSHYPFFIGDFAYRLSRQYRIPLIFTYHIMFEHYVHYLPVRDEGSKFFMIKMAAGYANFCDHVIAPSASVRDVLVKRKVNKPISVIPTGIDLKLFSKGDGFKFMRSHGIPADSFVVGHVGRLGKEKNIHFLTSALVEFLKKNKAAHALIVGQGTLDKMIRTKFFKAGLSDRLHATGFLHGQELSNAYHAMDVFAFASVSETQGMVLAEAMAAGVPVVALNAPAVCDVVKHNVNGLLVPYAQQELFVSALTAMMSSTSHRLSKMHAKARLTAKHLDIKIMARQVLGVYSKLVRKKQVKSVLKENAWERFVVRIKSDADIIKNFVKAAQGGWRHG